MSVAAAGVGIDDALRARLAAHIRDVPDFPQAGVLFKDITPLLADAQAFRECVDALAAPWRAQKINAICGIEARGFVFGAALARALDIGFVPLRKPGKLPAATLGADFELEYGQARLEVHADALAPGARVLIIDDVLATGGTAAAVARLVEDLGGTVVGMGFVIELDFLKGRDKLAGRELFSLIHY